ncbi:MAG: hypothetical protein MK132_23675 [Lentisphaerales bacterium]|nr:hypothetical protein [Lentisphaerales bacterium]
MGTTQPGAENKKERRKKPKKEPATPLTEIPSSGLNADQNYGVHKGFEGAVLDAKSGYVLPYRFKIMTPKKTAEKKFPLFIVFHGVGRVGSNNSRQVSMGLPLVKELEQLKVNAIVVQPQTAAGWAQKKIDGSKPVLASVAELIDYFITDKPADPDRVYVLGKSMGFGGVLNMVFDYPEHLAAAVPVVGGALHERAAEKSKLPTWMVTAEKNSRISIETCR